MKVIGKRHDDHHVQKQIKEYIAESKIINKTLLGLRAHQVTFQRMERRYLVTFLL